MGLVKDFFSLQQDRVPTMEKKQGRDLLKLQELLGGESQRAIGSLSNIASGQGNEARNNQLIQDYKQNLMPQLLQGTAHAGLLGASGLSGAVAQGGASLASMLEAQQSERAYDANKSLLNAYQSFMQQQPYRYGEQQPSAFEALLRNLETEGDSNTDSLLKLLGSVGGGALGGLFGGPAGMGIGSALGSKANKAFKFIKGFF